jgi:gentisate 1,2-dioxygenase
MPGAARLVFVDEMGSNLALAPLLYAYTYAPKEESGGPTTVHYYYPTTGGQEHTTLIASMRPS